MHLFEDLCALGKSPKLLSAVNQGSRVLNSGNKTHGVIARRGDGILGEAIPGENVVREPGFTVGRGVIATIEIGAECKVLAKAMVKQIDRVMTDMRNQVEQFNKGVGSKPITVAIVGVNHAEYTVGYEGGRSYRTGDVEVCDPTTGKKTIDRGGPNPASEAPTAIQRLHVGVKPYYDEMILLRYKAKNDSPFDFEWVDVAAMKRDYTASLIKISREYKQRF